MLARPRERFLFILTNRAYEILSYNKVIEYLLSSSGEIEIHSLFFGINILRIIF